MHSSSWELRARSFENGAEAYDRLRPEFPADVFTSICDKAGRRFRGRVLDVGAGTGRATLPLVRAGATVDVVEPSADMVRVLTERLEQEGLRESVRCRQATFEQVALDERYDVVVAAQSFHWTDPETRWARLHSLISPDGVAFLMWNGWDVDPDVHDLTAVAGVYNASGLFRYPDPTEKRAERAWAEAQVADEPHLTLVSKERFRWPWTLPVTDYLDLLRTISQYAVAPSDQCDALLSNLGRELGPEVTLRGHTLLLAIEAAS